MAATPTYRGTGQPAAGSGNGNGSGWFSRLGSMFGGRAEIQYAGQGQPAISGNASSPSYASPPIVPSGSCNADCPVDPQALADGNIAIVIPQQC